MKVRFSRFAFQFVIVMHCVYYVAKVFIYLFMCGTRQLPSTDHRATLSISLSLRKLARPKVTLKAEAAGAKANYAITRPRDGNRKVKLIKSYSIKLAQIALVDWAFMAERECHLMGVLRYATFIGLFSYHVFRQSPFPTKFHLFSFTKIEENFKNTFYRQFWSECSIPP